MSPSLSHARALVARAQDDRYVLDRLATDENAPTWVLGFHAQQAVEKALKAMLSLRGVEFPRTHNLSMLLELLRRAGATLPPDGEELVRLIPFGVALRYEDAVDGEVLSLDRDWALGVVARTLSWARDILRDADLPNNP